MTYNNQDIVINIEKDEKINKIYYKRMIVM